MEVEAYTYSEQRGDAMASVNYQNLIKDTGARFSRALKEGHGRKRADELSVKLLQEQYKAKVLRPDSMDFGKLFTECFGWEEFRSCREGKRLAHEVFEAAGAVSTAAFQNISGQIVYNAVLEAYEGEEFVFTKLIPEKQTPYNGEKIAGVSEIGDEDQIVGEGQDYPLAGVSEDWIETAEPVKRGKVVPVTREAVFFDRTGQVLQHCGDVGSGAGKNKEKRIIDAVVDEGTGATSARTHHRYRWRGTSIATYDDNTGAHTWDNLVAGNSLLSWVSLDAAEQAFNEMLDPYTGEPILIEPTHIVCTKQLEQVARRILNATEVSVATPGYATTANPTKTTMANPYASKYQLATSRYLATRMTTDTSWFLMNPKAWIYLYNWPLEVTQAPSNSSLEFSNDIIAQFKSSERGAVSTLNPRLSVKSTVA